MRTRGSGSQRGATTHRERRPATTSIGRCRRIYNTQHLADVPRPGKAAAGPEPDILPRPRPPATAGAIGPILAVARAGTDGFCEVSPTHTIGKLRLPDRAVR